MRLLMHSVIIIIIIIILFALGTSFPKALEITKAENNHELCLGWLSRTSTSILPNELAILLLLLLLLILLLLGYNYHQQQLNDNN